MESGLLTFKTDGMGTLSIEWDKIRSFCSKNSFEIVKKTGFSYFGSIAASGNPGFVKIVVTNDSVAEPIRDLVEITRIKQRFWKKFYGSVDLGLSYYKSTRNLQYYFNGELNYRGRKDLVGLGMNFLESHQKLTDTTVRSVKNDISLGYTHFFQGRWWGGVGGKYQENTELRLDYRFQAGVVGGYDIVHTNPVRFFAMAGILANREKPTDSVSVSNSMEGLLSLNFTWMQYRHPKIKISTSAGFYPGITIHGRYRFEYNLEAKYEIVTDLFAGITFYDDFDNKPISGGPALNDLSLVLTIGYSF